MNKDDFINLVKNKLEGLTLNDSKEIIANIVEKLPNDFYEKVLWIMY